MRTYADRMDDLAVRRDRHHEEAERLMDLMGFEDSSRDSSESSLYYTAAAAHFAGAAFYQGQIDSAPRP